MRRPTWTLWRVVASAAGLLGLLAVCLSVVGQSSGASTGALSLPHPISISAVHYEQRPLKVLLVGDSMAGSLGVGLGQLAAAYNVRLANAGMPGCSASMDGDVELTYFVAKPGWPCVKDHPGHLLATWQAWVNAFRPDVVLYLARSDVLNQKVNGHWTAIGHPRFNWWFARRLHEAASVLTSRGARLVLMTVPISQEHTTNVRSADKPIRVVRDARLLRHVAGQAGAAVSVYDLSALLTPHQRYLASSQDVPLRCADGIHVTPEAGMVVAADLYPRLWAIAAPHRVPGGGRWTGGPLPPTTPRWYERLAC